MAHVHARNSPKGFSLGPFFLHRNLCLGDMQTVWNGPQKVAETGVLFEVKRGSPGHCLRLSTLGTLRDTIN